MLKNNDSDGDGHTDSQEVSGITPSGMVSDPTRIDTDGDGFSDYVDHNPLGDHVIRIDFTIFINYDNMCQTIFISGTANLSVFFTIKMDGMEYVNTRLNSIKGASVNPGLTYYFDIWDRNSSCTITIEAWADNVDLGIGDVHMDFSNYYQEDWNLYCNYNTAYGYQYFYGNGHWPGKSCDGRDAALTVKVSTVTAPKANAVMALTLNSFELSKVSDFSYKY